MEQDLYQILGIPRDASPELVKSAFRRKARSSHPDAGGDPEEFQRLKMAYDVLNDSKNRRHYDETGEMPEDREDSEADVGHFRTLIGDLLMTMISQAGAPEFTDILLEARDSVELQISAVDRQIVTLSHLSARLGEVLRRLHGPADDEIVVGVLQQKLTEIQKKIKLSRALKRQLVKLQESLKLYSYDIETESIL